MPSRRRFYLRRSRLTPIKGAIDEALRCKETGEEKTILFGLTGTGYFDMTAYEAYLNGTMTDHVPTDEELQKGFDSLRRFRRTSCNLKMPSPPGSFVSSGGLFYGCNTWKRPVE